MQVVSDEERDAAMRTDAVRIVYAAQRHECDMPVDKKLSCLESTWSGVHVV